jgi:hypothetical protein
MPGILMSEMTHDESITRPDCRNSSADAKVAVAYPSDLINPFVASRTDGSSSMIEIMGAFLCKLKSSPTFSGAATRAHLGMSNGRENYT